MSTGHGIVEVGPDGYGGWKVEVIYVMDHGTTTEILRRPRLKSTAVKLGRAYAKKNRLELHVKNRRGQYTKKAESHGNDPKDVQG